mmetsp:Transcript_231/g.520  ORF Transcript_231/g.520 Transcript_231/m.520 type:complete len:218 (-) Transcript_231:3235-3888(-)
MKLKNWSKPSQGFPTPRLPSYARCLAATLAKRGNPSPGTRSPSSNWRTPGAAPRALGLHRQLTLANPSPCHFQSQRLIPESQHVSQPSPFPTAARSSSRPWRGFPTRLDWPCPNRPQSPASPSASQWRYASPSPCERFPARSIQCQQPTTGSSPQTGPRLTERWFPTARVRWSLQMNLQSAFRLVMCQAQKHGRSATSLQLPFEQPPAGLLPNTFAL